MIILPNGIPTLRSGQAALPPHVLARRLALVETSFDNHSDLVRNAVALEEYLEVLCAVVHDAGISTLMEATPVLDSSIGSQILWTNITVDSSVKDSLRRKNKAVEWTLGAELESTIVALSFVYARLGLELTNELIEVDLDSLPQEKWKQVVAFYKKASEFLLFGQHLPTSAFNPIVYALLLKINALSTQLSILAKLSWLNRRSFHLTESFDSTNNGALSRVAIYVLNELKECSALLGNFSGEGFHIKISGWDEYLAMVQKYVSAYAGLFLSIEFYQKDNLGQAIGLVNYSLLTLQSKNVASLGSFSKLKSKLSSRKHNNYIQNLESITTLNVDKSIFRQSSGIVLKDLSYLFDLLVQARLKYTKENDNLRFDTVAKWLDVHADSKWPVGRPIPTAPIEPFVPKAYTESSRLGLKENYTGQGAYF